ncbi:sulfur transferase domain-containing protein [Oculatella sp. FACHB-28]|uniref:beta-lactamase hydrolase domain-containing protein n=1 Tax=Oculatella sp. FACHB-28 TaxID=2692845 RepID=UPI0018EFDD89|nr:sulfur transferase domain-containing protein [Oculatella sp. FACHB-28]
MSDEQQQAEAAGLAYSNVPLSNSNLSNGQVSEALEALEGLPKPVLIHCGAGARAGAIALIAKATQENLSPEDLTEQAEQLGLEPDQPHLKQFIETHHPPKELLPERH